MEYFRLEPDIRISNSGKIHIDEKLFLKGEPFVHFMNMKDGGLPSFFIIKCFTKSYFCFSDEVKRILDIYVDEFKRAIPFFPTDRDINKQEVYWNLELQQKDYLNYRKLYSNEEPVICKEPDANCYCFQFSDEVGSYFIVSLHIVEHLLRYEIMGIKFIPVKRKV